MDFPIAAPIRERLCAVIEAGDLGYPAPDRCGVREALTAWLESEQGWAPAPDAVVVLPDVMRGVELAILAHTGPGDAIAVPTPVYPPFLSVVAENGRRLVQVPLARDGDRVGPDLDAIAAALADGARMVLLCHPHNPTGHVHAADELAALAELAAHHGATVVSDEIHAPLTLDGRPHVPFATVSETAAACAITLTSASKAWNVPGLKTAFLIAEEDALRAPIMAMRPRARMGCSILGLEASAAAFEDGGAWLRGVLEVLERNRDLVVERLAATGIDVLAPSATYLMWLDCTQLGLPVAPSEFFLERARVALSDGRAFGAGGEGCARLNFATGLRIVEEIVTRMEAALRAR